MHYLVIYSQLWSINYCCG